MSNPVETQAATGIDRSHGIECLKQMLRIRRLEERCAELYTATKIRGFLHLYNGEEAVAVGVVQALGSDDAIVATYREHGHALVRGISAGPSTCPRPRLLPRLVRHCRVTMP